MPEYQLQIKQVVDYPRCRIYREFIQQTDQRPEHPHKRRLRPLSTCPMPKDTVFSFLPVSLPWTGQLCPLL